MTTPKRPVAPDQVAEASPATQIESNDAIQTNGPAPATQIESNDAVQTNGPAPVDSIITMGPRGTEIETFTGVQENVAWVMPSASAAPGAE